MQSVWRIRQLRSAFHLGIAELRICIHPAQSASELALGKVLWRHLSHITLVSIHAHIYIVQGGKAYLGARASASAAPKGSHARGQRLDLQRISYRLINVSTSAPDVEQH